MASWACLQEVCTMQTGTPTACAIMIARLVASPSTSGGMDQRQSPQVATARKTFEHDLVVDHDRALVRHEVLEAVDAALDDRGHLLRDAIRPPGDRDVEGIVGDRLLAPFGLRARQA